MALIPVPHTPHNFDKLGVEWRTLPFGVHDDAREVAEVLFPELAEMLAAGGKVLVHQDELSDRVAGLTVSPRVGGTAPHVEVVAQHRVGALCGVRGQSVALDHDVA